MTKHTPGPWAVSVKGTYIGITHKATKDNPLGGLVCKMHSGRRNIHDDANLIAAAPETAAECDRLREINAELLEALRYGCDVTCNRDEITSGMHRFLGMARAAIAKAENHG